MTTAKKTDIPCAACGRMTSFFAEPTGPFCSKRCQMIDLGRWLGEEYRISDPLRPDHFVELEEGEES